MKCTKQIKKTLVMSRKNSYTCEVVQINIRFKKKENKNDDFDTKSKNV